MGGQYFGRTFKAQASKSTISRRPSRMDIVDLEVWPWQVLPRYGTGAKPPRFAFVFVFCFIGGGTRKSHDLAPRPRSPTGVPLRLARSGIFIYSHVLSCKKTTASVAWTPQQTNPKQQSSRALCYACGHSARWPRLGSCVVSLS